MTFSHHEFPNNVSEVGAKGSNPELHFRGNEDIFQNLLHYSMTFFCAFLGTTSRSVTICPDDVEPFFLFGLKDYISVVRNQKKYSGLHTAS